MKLPYPVRSIVVLCVLWTVVWSIAILFNKGEQSQFSQMALPAFFGLIQVLLGYRLWETVFRNYKKQLSKKFRSMVLALLLLAFLIPGVLLFM